MNPLHSMRFFLAPVLFLVTISSHAALVHWEFDNVVLSDGQTITGGFDFDADTIGFSNISVFNSGTSTFAAREFDFHEPPSCYFTECRFYEDEPALDGVFVMLRLKEFMTNTGGTIGLQIFIDEDDPLLRRRPFIFNCLDENCQGGLGLNTSLLMSGSIIGTTLVATVPIPASLWLLASAIIGLISVKKLPHPRTLLGRD